MAPSPCNSAPRASSSWSWFRAASIGDAAPPPISTPAKRPRVDSPAWHLVQALNTLVSADGNDPAIDGFADKARPLSAAEKKMIAVAAKRLNEDSAKKADGRGALGPRRELAGVAGTADVAAHGEYRGPGRRLHGPGRQDDPARIARSRRSICAWCPT